MGPIRKRETKQNNNNKKNTPESEGEKKKDLIIHNSSSSQRSSTFAETLIPIPIERCEESEVTPNIQWVVIGKAPLAEEVENYYEL